MRGYYEGVANSRPVRKTFQTTKKICVQVANFGVQKALYGFRTRTNTALGNNFITLYYNNINYGTKTIQFKILKVEFLFEIKVRIIPYI